MSCTGIELISKQGHPYWGRTQDFEQHFEYAGIKIPKGYRFERTYTPIETKQSVMGIVWGKDLHDAPVILDGINESGICGGSFYFDHFYRYVPTEEITAAGKTAIRGQELCTWVLTQYSSLDEIKERLAKDIGITSEDEGSPMMGMSVPQHCFFTDATGRSIVVEPSVPNGFKIFENPLGVITNAPPFDWHLSNVKTWLERTTKRTYTYQVDEPIEPIKFGEFTSGLVGIPADYKPESRFLRAAFERLLSVQTDDRDTLNQIFQLLTSENTPKGSLRIDTSDGQIYAFTQYTAGYDILNRTLSTYTYDNRNLMTLNFGDPEKWPKRMSFFSFIRPQTTTSFVPEDSWNKGDNMI